MIAGTVDWVALGVAAATLLSAFAVAKTKSDNDRQRIGALERWKNDHEKTAAHKQGEYEGKISTMQSQLAVGDERFKTFTIKLDDVARDVKFLIRRELGRRSSDREGDEEKT